MSEQVLIDSYAVNLTCNSGFSCEINHGPYFQFCSDTESRGQNCAILHR